jgi:hypothetical protein
MCRLTHITLCETSVNASQSEQEYRMQWRWYSCTAPYTMFKKNRTWYMRMTYHSEAFASFYVDLSAHFAHSYASFLCVLFANITSKCNSAKTFCESWLTDNIWSKCLRIFLFIMSANKPDQTPTYLPTYLPICLSVCLPASTNNKLINKFMNASCLKQFLVNFQLRLRRFATNIKF